MTIQLTESTRALLIEALPAQDREHLERLLETLQSAEYVEGYDDDLRASDEHLRQTTGLGQRAHDALKHLTAMSDDTRTSLINALQETRGQALEATQQPADQPDDTTAQQPQRRFTTHEIVAANNQDSLHSVERLALHIVGYLALRAWLGNSHLAAGGLEALYNDVASALRSGLKRVDFIELKSIDDDQPAE